MAIEFIAAEGMWTGLPDGVDWKLLPTPKYANGDIVSVVKQEHRQWKVFRTFIDPAQAKDWTNKDHVYAAMRHSVTDGGHLWFIAASHIEKLRPTVKVEDYWSKPNNAIYIEQLEKQASALGRYHLDVKLNYGALCILQRLLHEDSYRPMKREEWGEEYPHKGYECHNEWLNYLAHKGRDYVKYLHDSDCYVLTEEGKAVALNLGL